MWLNMARLSGARTHRGYVSEKGKAIAVPVPSSPNLLFLNLFILLPLENRKVRENRSYGARRGSDVSWQWTSALAGNFVNTIYT